MGKVNSKQKALNAVKLDEDKELKDLLRENLELKDSYINRGETNTALCMTAYYGSQRCANLLLESGNDVNIPDKQVGLTPLMIASKKNYPNLVDLFLFHGADPKMKCSRGLNALDYAIVHGNYLISYNFTTKEILTPEKTLEEYLKINRQFSFPLFNLPLFYQTLMSKVEPDKTPTFCLTFDKRKKFEGKIPDPDETWGHFFSRLMRLELHNPPMVSIERVPLKRRTTTYVRTQSKLLEIEYNINSNIKDNTLVNLENPNENDPESNVELPKVEEHSKEESKRSDISNSHLFKNPEVNDENSIKIEEKQEN